MQHKEIINKKKLVDYALAVKKLLKKHWKVEDTYWISPNTSCEYSFEDACRIADINISEHTPNSLLWDWIRS